MNEKINKLLMNIFQDLELDDDLESMVQDLIK